MQDFGQKQVKIQVRRNNNDLFYTGIIDEITQTHITFTDKFNKQYMYRVEDVIQVRVI